MIKDASGISVFRMSKQHIESFCFCLAVKHGLLIWGYAKLVVSLLVALTFIFLSTHMFSRVPESYDYAVLFLECVATTILELLDLIFTLILIVAAHKRVLKMLEVYYFYSMTMLAVYLLVLLLTACSQERFRLLHDLIFHHAWVFELDLYSLWGFAVGNICLQTYLVLLVRSEVMKQREVKKAKLARQKSTTSFRGLRAGLVTANNRSDV